MSKDKIEGAYILLKRFKNRLKGFDSVIKKVSDEKADREDFVRLEQSMAKGRAESVFVDMKILFDSTVKQFDQKVVYERKEVAKAYERIVEKQRAMILGFEMKYDNMIKGRMDRLEAVMDDLAFEQAKLNANGGITSTDKHLKGEDSKFDEGGLFPNTISRSVDK